jgi:phosphatidate cytidylyltransferase
VLKQRIITAVVVAPLALALVFYAPHWLFAAAMAGMALAGAWEWAALAGGTGKHARLSLVFAFAILIVAAGALQQVRPYPEVLFVLSLLALAWWLFALVWISTWRTEFPPALKRLCGALTLLPSLAAVVAVQAVNPWYLLILLFLIWAADIGAYFAGRAFGRHKLAPQVSPGKTWEGVAGGLAFAILVAAVADRWLPVEPGPFILICMGVTLLSIVGDLSESLFKRQAGLKDSGTLFPGHGGVLDRVDSLTASAPLFWLGMRWLGLLP